HGPGLDRCIVGNNQTGVTTDLTDSRDDARGWYVTPIGIHLPGGPEAEFKKSRLRVDQLLQSFANRKATKATLTIHSGCAGTQSQLRFFLFNGLGCLAESRHADIPGEFRAMRNSIAER